MSIEELKKLNDDSVENLNQYFDSVEKYEQGTVKNYDIFKYYQAKHLYRKLIESKEIFNVNAIRLANLIRNKLNNKFNNKNFELAIKLLNAKTQDFDTKFYKTKRTQYDFALVIKNKEDKSIEIPIVKGSYGITSQNNSDFIFDEDFAINIIEKRDVNLLDNQLLHIANVDNYNECISVKLLDLNDFLWSIVELRAKEINQEKINEIDKRMIELDRQKADIEEKGLEL